MTTTPLREVPSVLPVLELRLEGDLDISTLPVLRERLEEALSLGPRRLVVDFAACRYLDAQAILVLLEAHRAMWRREGRLVLRHCSSATTRLLALAGVLNVFEIEGEGEIEATDRVASGL